MSLTKAQLVKAIASDTRLSQKKTSVILTVLLDILTSTMAKGDCISIRGFGKFHVKYIRQRKIRHPSTGKIIMVEPRKVARFKYFKSLLQEINFFDYDIDKFNRENELILKQLYDLIKNSGDYEEEEIQTFNKRIERPHITMPLN